MQYNVICVIQSAEGDKLESMRATRRKRQKVRDGVGQQLNVDAR